MNCYRYHQNKMWEKTAISVSSFFLMDLSTQNNIKKFATETKQKCPEDWNNLEVKHEEMLTFAHLSICAFKGNLNEAIKGYNHAKSIAVTAYIKFYKRKYLYPFRVRKNKQKAPDGRSWQAYETAVINRANEIRKQEFNYLFGRKYFEYMDNLLLF